MCTVIVVNHHYKEFPLVIAANRDEDYNRASSPVQVLAKEPHLIIGGKDDVKGGTWLGVNKHSLFVTGTNQGARDPDMRSRGLLIMDALKCTTLKELINFVEELNPAKYSKFNLIFGDSKTAFIAHSYLLHSMVIRELPPGVHVISSDMKFTGEEPKTQFVHMKLDQAINTPWLEYYNLLKEVLASSKYGLKIKPRVKESGRLYGHCTRSSSILAFSDSGLERYKFHDRTIPRPKKKRRKEGEEEHLAQKVPSRYKDYIDLFQHPDAATTEASSEEKVEQPSPKEVILNAQKKILKKAKSVAEEYCRSIYGNSHTTDVIHPDAVDYPGIARRGMALVDKGYEACEKDGSSCETGDDYED